MRNHKLFSDTWLAVIVLGVTLVILLMTGFHFKNDVPNKEIGKAMLQGTRPNIVVILADDLGYSDIGSYGNPIVQTPNIDALGKEGVRFTQAYASAPICSPSRAG